MGFVRFILSLGVMFEHSNFSSPIIGSYSAIQCFYVLSGFYMSLIVNQNKYKTNSHFYKSRFLRIYPLYFCWLGLSLFLFFFARSVFNISTPLDDFFDGDIDMNKKYFMAGINGIIFFSDLLWLFDDSITLLLIPVVWSLALEIYFYLLVPFLIRIKSGILLFIILFVISFRLFSYILLDFDDPPFHARIFAFEIVYFLLGILSYRLYLRWKFCNAKFLGVIITFLNIATFLVFNYLSYFFSFVHIYGIPDFLFTQLIVFQLVLSLPFIFSICARSKVDRFVGNYSYPIYLIHYTYVILFIHSGLGNYLFVFLLTMITSVFAHYFVTIPIDRVRHSRYSD